MRGLGNKFDDAVQCMQIGGVVIQCLMKLIVQLSSWKRKGHRPRDTPHRMECGHGYGPVVLAT